MTTQFTDLTPDVAHRIALHAGDEKAALSMMELLPPYREYVEKNTSVENELYDAVAENNVVHTQPNPNFTESTHMAFGVPHRGGGKVAAVGRNVGGNTGPLVTHSYYERGKLHRDGDKPAQLTFKESLGSDQPFNTMYYQHGVKHRDGDRPASIFEGANLGTAPNFANHQWFVNGARRRASDYYPVTVTKTSQRYNFDFSKLSRPYFAGGRLPTEGSAEEYEAYLQPHTVRRPKRKRDA